MRFHWGLGVGHVYTHGHNGKSPAAVIPVTDADRTEVPIIGLGDDNDLPGITNIDVEVSERLPTDQMARHYSDVSESDTNPDGHDSDSDHWEGEDIGDETCDEEESDDDTFLALHEMYGENDLEQFQ